MGSGLGKSVSYMPRPDPKSFPDIETVSFDFIELSKSLFRRIRIDAVISLMIVLPKFNQYLNDSREPIRLVTLCKINN
jgi:hypothetical protein